MVQQATSAGVHGPWARAAIHDSVAEIVRQAPYQRDLPHTLLDRVVRWVAELFDRIFAGMRGLPHGREVAVVTTAVIVLLVVGRIVYARRLRRGALEDLADGGVQSRALTDPWRDAERLANAGQYTDAAHALYRAVLAALAARGYVRPHASKTSGDFARELRRRGAPAETSFRQFGAHYDRLIYGTGVCDADDYRALLEKAQVVFANSQRERAA